MAYTKLDRVRPSPAGVWDSARTYTALELVNSPDGWKAYLARKAVPAGTALTDTTYWTEVLDVSDVIAAAQSATPDDSSVNGKPWTSKKIVDSLCQPFEETGNPVQCYPVENYPLGVKVHIEPTQEGSGDPGPDNIRPITGMDTVSVTRCGNNLFDINNENTEFISNNKISYTLLDNWGGGYVYFKKRYPAGKYCISCKATINGNQTSFRFLCDKPFTTKDSGISVEYNSYYGGYLANIYIPTEITFTVDSEFKLGFVLSSKNGNIGDILEISEICLNAGDGKTDYEPYTGETYDIALPEMVYGGELDVQTGVLEKTWRIIQSYNGEEMSLEWISDRDVYSSTSTPTVGAQVAYKLAEPTTIQLTPQKVTSLSGVNTIYTDAENVIVTGREDPKHTITELKNAILSLGGNI